MNSRIERLFAKERRRIEKHQRLVKRSQVNWPIQKEKVLEVFRSFQAVADDLQVNIHTGLPRPPYRDIPGDYYIGEDSITLGFETRPTGRVDVSIDESGRKRDRELEVGASLVISFVENTGALNTFLLPPRLIGGPNGKDGGRQKADILIHTTYSIDKISADHAYKMLKLVLIFRRVESPLEGASRWEKLRVRWWRFIDIRNRRGINDQLANIFTPWEKLIVTGLLAALGVSLLTDGLVTFTKLVLSLFQ